MIEDLSKRLHLKTFLNISRFISDFFFFLVCAHAWQLNVCLGRGVCCQYVSKCVSVKVGWCLFLCLNTKTEKWSDRSNAWVNKLPV